MIIVLLSIHLANVIFETCHFYKNNSRTFRLRSEEILSTFRLFFYQRHCHLHEKYFISAGASVLKVTATDPDADAQLEYSLVEPIRAVDKTGVALKSTTPYDYKTTFRINSTTGLISVNRMLDYQVAAVTILTVQARDLKAVVDKEEQIAKVEVTIYIQAYSNDNPMFTNPGWSPNNPTIKVTVSEEQPLGTTLLMLSAKEPTTGHPVQRFELVREDDDEGYVNVGVQSGNVVLSKRLDYEELNQKVDRSRDFERIVYFEDTVSTHTHTHTPIRFSVYSFQSASARQRLRYHAKDVGGQRDRRGSGHQRQQSDFHSQGLQDFRLRIGEILENCTEREGDGYGQLQQRAGRQEGIRRGEVLIDRRERQSLRGGSHNGQHSGEDPSSIIY